MADTEIAAHASFDRIRYAQVWEDADMLVEALRPGPDDVVVSVASAGDNALALVGENCARVIAVDISPAQLACVRLRVAAYRTLAHDELLELMGSRPSDRRRQLLACAARLVPERDRRLWSGLEPDIVAHGIGGVGKFERYFRIFRRYVLPLVHSRGKIAQLLEPKSAEDRRLFYERRWDTTRWRWLLKGFFSRAVMGRLGRDPAFFRHAQGSLPDQVARLTRRALVDQDPAENPYLHWILTGTHGAALPRALRPERFDPIRERLDRLDIRRCTVEALADQGVKADAFNLSDIFEYMSDDAHAAAYASVLAASNPGARIAYWNMMVARRAPASMAGRIVTRDDVQAELVSRDKAFFYQDFVVEEVQ